MSTMWLKNHFIIILFNIIFGIIGITLTALGVVYKLDFEEVAENLRKTSFTTNADILITVGVLIFLFASFGFYASFKKSTFMLTTYGIILILLGILQATAGVLSLTFSDYKFEIQSAVDLKTVFDEKTIDSAEYFNFIQENVHCCGVKGSRDYGLIALLKLPDSCCKDKDTVCSSFTAYKHGCARKIVNYVDENAAIIGYIAVITTAIEIVGAAISFITVALS